ncbi:MAG: phosphoenolpyruvate carboxykinase domain-containing protein, partial [Ktedonobacterales bacterium]
YNMGDYWQHWLDMGKKLTKPPVVFHVNWFRKGPDGKFLWPGFGQNIRVLMWMQERIAGTGKAQETAIGYVPTPDALDLDGLDISDETLHALLAVDPADWEQEAADQSAFFAQFGDHLPAAITAQHQALVERLSAAPVR